MFRQYKTFFGDDIWNALTEQARFDEVLDETISVNSIAASWITKDRLPVISVNRNYRDKSVTITQVPVFLLFVCWFNVFFIESLLEGTTS